MTLFAFSSKAQDVRLTVQTGHSAAITEMTYSHDGDYIITGGEDNKIIVWDVFTGKQFLALLGHQKKITGITLHPDGNVLLSCSADSTIRLWDLREEKCLQVLKHTEPLSDIAFSPNGEQFIVGEKSIYRYRFPSLEKSKIGVNALVGFTSVVWSPGGKYFAFGGEQEKKGYLFNDSLNRLEHQYLAKITDIEFDRSESSVYYSTTEGQLVQRGLDIRARNSTTTDWMLNSVNSVEVTDSLIFMASDRGEITVLDKKNWLKHRILLSSRQKISKIVLSKHGNFLAAAGGNRAVVIWDLEKNRVVKVLKGLVNRINDIAFTTDGQEIVIGYADGEVRRTNLITNISVLNHLRPKSKSLLDMGEFSVSRIEKISGDSVEFDVFFARKSLEYEGVYDKLVEHDVLWNLAENALTVSEKKSKSKLVKKYLSDSKDGKLQSPSALLLPELLTESSQKLDVSVEVKENEVFVRTYDKSKTNYVIITGHSDIISSVAINERYGFLATASWDGMIRFWDIASGELLTVFGAFGRGQYVYLNSDNYYFASKNALDYIGFKLEDKLFSFDQFDLIYNRPDLIVDKLPYFDEEYKMAYYKAYKKRLSKMGIEEENLEISKNVPLLEVERLNVEEKGKKQGESITETELKLRIRASDEVGKLDKLHIKVNGVPEFGIFGKSIGAVTYDQELTLNLTPGVNYVQVNVVNEQGISSYISAFNVNVREDGLSSDLYVVSIGSSKFVQSQYNLSFAEKDAIDFADYFERDHGDYRTCFIKKFVNEEVTRENLEQIREFLSKARENDVILLFAAGHGVLDSELDYYFSSYDLDFDNPSQRGISYDFFETLLADARSRKKVMFIDACHSGEIDKDEVIENFVLEEQGEIKFRGVNRTIKNIEAINSFDLSKTLFADMRMNSGITVISSAGGAEYAIEGAEWDNSVFTYCLLNGLKYGLADLNRDKSVRLSELQEFVLFEVSKLTKGMQTPTSRAENLKNDFVIQ